MSDVTGDDVTTHLLAVLLIRWVSLSDVTFTCVNLLMTPAKDGASCMTDQHHCMVPVYFNTSVVCG